MNLNPQHFGVSQGERTKPLLQSEFYARFLSRPFTNSMTNTKSSSSSMIHPSVRVRFAPSPTGGLHIGVARTALYSYLFAKRKKGTFILRIEDTDLERSTDEHLQTQLLDLKWLGLDWDEGPCLNDVQKNQGDFAPYRQSQRLPFYKREAEKLLAKGQAYYCFLTEEEWAEKRKSAQKKHLFFQAQSPYRNGSLKEALKKMQKGEKATIRFKNDFKKDFFLKDKVRGEVKFPSNMVGDFVLVRSNGMPVYNFCCVVDDHLMKITHVFRAEDHLSNTLRQMMLYETLNYPLPEFGHLSLVLGPDRQKLSKRHGATTVSEYKNLGFLPEALNNFMALLGWSSPTAQEILSLQELCEQFSLERLHVAPALFDEKRLNWINSCHIKSLPPQDLWTRMTPFLKEEQLELPRCSEWRERSLTVFKKSMETLKDGTSLFKPFSENSDFSVSEEGRAVLGWKNSHSLLQAWCQFLMTLEKDFISKEEFSQALTSLKKTHSVKGKELFMPLRVAVLGHPQGAELKEVIPLFSRKKLIQKVSTLLSSHF